MTLPTLIGNYQKKQTAIQLKKVYSIMQQAVQKAELDNESIKYWDFSLGYEKFINNYIKPYYSIIKFYNQNDGPEDIHYTCQNGSSCDVVGDIQTTPKMIVADGTLYHIGLTSSTLESGERVRYAFITVDLNGFKKPNKYGRDMFVFSLSADYGVQPYGVGYIWNETAAKENYDRDYFLNGNNARACQKNGMFCAAVIMMDGWEIKDDYPW